MERISERIKNVMSVVFDVPVEEIKDNASHDSISNWDSLRHLNLVIALEEEFEISIPDEEVGNMLNFKLIELVINECKKQ
jgi:acyl carrier protein